MRLTADSESVIQVRTTCGSGWLILVIEDKRESKFNHPLPQAVLTYGPKRCRYSLETMNALTISAA